MPWSHGVTLGLLATPLRPLSPTLVGGHLQARQGLNQCTSSPLCLQLPALQEASLTTNAPLSWDQLRLPGTLSSLGCQYIKVWNFSHRSQLWPG